jgi:hypothetical protein
MDSKILEILAYLLIFIGLPILLLLIIALVSYIKGKKKFEQEQEKEDKPWNEYEDIDFE